MNKYINFLDKYKWFVAIIIPLLILALASNLKNLQMEGSYRIWFGKDSTILKNYDDFRTTFGNDESIIIAFKDENTIFNKKALQTIQNITDKLWKMKYIARVDSLTNYQYIHADPENMDDILVNDFIQDIDQMSISDLEDRKKIALKDPLIKDAFISSDAKTTLISARLIPKVADKEDKSFEIMGLLHQILKPEIKNTGYKFWLNGSPPLNTSFVEIGSSDATTFTPLVILIAIIMLLLLFRKISGATIPLLVVILTFLTVLAIQVLLGYKLNNFTANIPVFIVAIGIADAVHVYIIWLMYKKQGEDTKIATLHAMQKNILPVFLTSITTAIGFATLGISKVIPVATLGIATASGAILAFVISVIWLPAMLLFLKKEIKQKAKRRTSVFKKINYGNFIVTHDKKIVIITSFLFGLLALGLLHIKVDSNTIRYFDKDVEIRKSTEFLMQNITGPMLYEIVIDSGTSNGIKDPKFLNKVEEFYKAYQEKYPDVRHMYSLLDVIKRFNKTLNQSYTVPQNKDLIAQYLLLYSLSLPQGMEINDKMDIEERYLRVSARMNIVDTSLDLEMMNFAQNYWKDTPYSGVVNGQTAMFAHMQNDVSDTLIYSMSLAILMVSMIMLLIFKRIKMIWVFLIPNILPVLLVVGLMGWLQITIDIGVAMAGAIIIGVAVDDTIHFLVKYFAARKKGLSMSESFDEVLKYAGKAILFTTIILSLSFAIFAFSKFTPNSNFGIVTASALVLALLIDLLLLPALLSLNDKRENH